MDWIQARLCVLVGVGVGGWVHWVRLCSFLSLLTMLTIVLLKIGVVDDGEVVVAVMMVVVRESTKWRAVVFF